MKTGPVDPQIPGLRKIIFKKELTQAKHIARWAGMPTMLKKAIIDSRLRNT